MHSLSKLSPRFALIALVAALGGSAHAIIATNSQTVPMTPDTTYSYVGNLNGSSAVAVGPYTILSSSHVYQGSGNFILSGKTYTPSSYVVAPGTELALIHLDPNGPALPGYYSIANSFSIGSTITMVGVGATGLVNSAGTGYAAQSASQVTGTRYAGNGVVQKLASVTNIGPSLLSYMGKAGDAVTAGFDSGGGWFNSAGQLVGISDFTYNDSLSDPNGPKYADYNFGASNTAGYTSFDGTFVPAGGAYFASGAINLTDPSIQSFFRANPVPEPGTWAALGLGTLAFLRRKRR